MAETTIPGTGEYADIALGPDGQVYLCAETKPRDAVLVFRGARGQEVIALCDGAVVGGQKLALYPRLAVNPFGQIAVVYQKGASICVSLIGVRDDIRPEAEEPFGVEMVCVGWVAAANYWRVAYVARIFGAIRLVTRDYDRAGVEIGQSWTATDTTQGVSRILSDGSVVLIDADNIWPEYPNLSRPWQSGSLVVGQGNDAPARALGYTNGNTAKTYRVFDSFAFRPRSVEITPGRWTVIATGDRIGIRVVDVPPFVPDVVETAPIVPLPAGTVIADTLPYVIGTPGAWPRTGDEGGNMDCVPIAGQDAVAWVKFASPPFCEWWRWTSEYIYHHEDRSDGLDQPYHFARDEWIKRRWAVGEQIDSRADNWLFRTADNGASWSSRPWAMVLRFIAAIDAYPCGGDIGTAPVIVVEYDATYTLEPRRGYVERFWYAAGWGWWRWQSFKFGTTPPDFSPPSNPTADTQARYVVRRNAMSSGRAPLVEDAGLVDGVFHRLGGVRVTPINPVRAWTAAPPIEPPTEEPMKPREQFYREFQEVNAFYQADDGLKRPGGMMLNDPSRCDVEAMGAWGYDLAAGKTVNDCKNAIVRSEEWAQKHPGQTPPTFP